MQTDSSSGAAGERTIAFIAVGSNIDPERNVPAALRSLMQFTGVKATSTFYRTRPLERPEQPMFCNGVWKLETLESPRELKFEVLRRIERELGRVRTEDSHASRPIDLDLILYGDRVIREPGLCIPDPDLRHRPFVAIPLLELASDLVLPDTRERISSLPVARNAAGLEALEDLTQQLERLIRQ